MLHYDILRVLFSKFSSLFSYICAYPLYIGIFAHLIVFIILQLMIVSLYSIKVITKVYPLIHAEKL